LSLGKLSFLFIIVETWDVTVSLPINVVFSQFIL
jgi:hypothetical protein